MYNENATAPKVDKPRSTAPNAPRLLSSAPAWCRCAGNPRGWVSAPPPDRCQWLGVATMGELQPLVSVLVEAGADIVARDAVGQTPLHRLAVNFDVGECSDEAESVCNYSSHSVRTSTPRIGTPTRRSIWQQHAGETEANRGMVIALLNAGASATPPNSKGQPPWDIAKDNPGLRSKCADACRRLRESTLKERGEAS